MVSFIIGCVLGVVGTNFYKKNSKEVKRFFNNLRK